MRILVVEDDPKIASFLRTGLSEAGYIVDCAEDGNEAASLANATEYTAAVVDLMLPGVDGLTFLRGLRARKVRTPVIVLSAKRSVEDRVECLDSGADDYLSKPFALSELLARLQAVLRRGPHSTEPTTYNVADLRVDCLSRRVERSGQTVDLHPREYALLELMIKNRGRALSKTFLLEKLWDYSFDPQTNVVDVLVCRLRNKVDKGFDQKLIYTLRGVGYVLRAN